MKLAGIPKRDDRGRTVDVHALRHSFGTHLSKGGVPLRTAQAPMRHSDPSLTANVYTDPKLLDVVGALDVLPALPLDGPRQSNNNVQRALTIWRWKSLQQGLHQMLTILVQTSQLLTTLQLMKATMSRLMTRT